MTPLHVYGNSVSILPQVPTNPTGPSALDSSVGVSRAAVPGFGTGSSSDALVSERAKVVEERDALIMQNQEVTLRLEGLE